MSRPRPRMPAPLRRAGTTALQLHENLGLLALSVALRPPRAR